MTNFVKENLSDFNLGQTLECGQCFHFVKIEDSEYIISAKNRMLHIEQKDNALIFHDTTEQEYEEIWKDYFDLDRDYAAIKEALLSRDDKLKTAIDAMYGVRILNQDFFETLISFIISQNQQIPKIKQIVKTISEKYGNKCGEMYSFPDALHILNAGVDGIRECKAGFRSAYIIDACEKFESGLIDENKLRNMEYDECIEQLKQIKGVGDKVANCVALFSLGKRNAFPVDVWIKRIMEAMYFGKVTPIPAIQKLAKELFGEYGGYAQQYLFYYGKINSIGK